MVNTLPGACEPRTSRPQSPDFRFLKEIGSLAPERSSAKTLLPLCQPLRTEREIFATSKVFEGLESIDAKGYESWNVMLHHAKKPSEKIRQIYVPGVAYPGLLETEMMRQVQCRTCGTIKYYVHKKGVVRIRKGALLPHVDFIRTYEWFGVGLVSFQEILISNKVAALVLDQGWQGVRMKVVETV